jgi:anti-anti-sigma factor
VLSEVTTESRTPAIELREPVAGGDWAAVVALLGEHDLATRDAVAETLEPIFGNVLIDLSECTFVDSAIIAVLITAYQSLAREGHRVELRLPAGGYVRRTLSVSGVDAIIPLHQS